MRFVNASMAFAILGLLCVGLVGFLGVVAFRAIAASLPADAALRVGDRVVTIDELDQRGAALRALFGVEPPAGGTELRQYRQHLAKSVAVSVVIQQAAALRHITVSDQDCRLLLDQYVRENYPQGHGAYVKALGDAGASEPQLLQEVRLQAITGKLLKNVTMAAPPVTDFDVRSAFNQSRGQLIAPESRRVDNIVVSTESDARHVFDEAVNGAKFSDLAEKYSLDDSSRMSGGDIGMVVARILEKPYSTVAFGARQGEVFGPVQTRNGWNVGEVTQIVPQRALQLNEVSAELRDKIASDRALNMWRLFVDQQLEHANVTYAPDYRPADPGALDLALPSPEDAGVTQAEAEEQQPTRHTVKLPAMATGTQALTLPESNTGSALAYGLAQLLAAAVVFALGRWGRRQAHLFPPSNIPYDQRKKRARTYYRGSLACQVVGVVLAVAVVVSIAVRVLT
jgi:peptidyl-prolyl cis-trans isomerase C